MRNNFVVEVVKEGRDYVKLVNFYLKDQVYMIPGKEYYDIPDEIFTKFRYDVVNGQKVVIKKKLLESKKYKIEDFKIKKTKKFEEEKQKMLVQMRNKVAGLSIATSFFEIYEFIVVTGMLASQGVFITDENRESTYLNIINTGDEGLISALERYLEIKDSMDSLVSQYKNVSDYMKRLQKVESKEELTAVKETWGK